MAEPKVYIRRSSVPGKIPTTAQLAAGELAVNTYDGKVYLEQDQGAVGVGTTVIVVNPWNVGLGSDVYNTYFTAGNVGIGSTIPTSKFHVIGDSLVVGVSTANSFRARGGSPGALGVNNNGYGFFGSGDNDSGMYSSADGQIEFYNNAGEAARITSSGNILINTTTETGTSTQKLQVNSGAYFSGNVGVGTTFASEPGLTVLNKVQILQLSDSTSRLIFRAKPGNAYRWNIDNDSSNLFRIFREDDATSANGFVAVSISTIGTLTATKFVGDGSGLTGIVATGSGVAIRSNGSPIGTASTLNFSTGLDVIVGSGIATITATPTNSSQWVSVNPGIYTTSSVGIGTTNPQAPLQIEDVLALDSSKSTTTSTSQVSIDTFSSTVFRSAKYQIQVTCPGQISTLGGITTGGRGYTAGTFNITFATSSGTGSTAQGSLTISNGVVGIIGLGTTGGSGYTTGDILTASGGSGLQVSVSSTASPSGRITGLALTTAGTGYTGYYNSTTGTGTTTLALLGGTGSGAVGLATIYDGVVTSATLLQQPTTGTGGTVYYAGSNYTTSSVLTINNSDVTNIITTITGSVGVSTFTSLTAHGIGVSDVVRVSSTSNGLTAGTNYYVVTVPSSTTFTLGISTGIGTTFTTGTGLSIPFYRNSSRFGGSVAYANAISGVSTNYQVSDILVLQNGTTADYVEYATIANGDILGTFATDISGGNARLLFTPTYPNNNIKIARQTMTI